MPFNIVQRYYNHYGVDLRSNELTRPTSFAADMLNAQYTAGGVIEKRKGFKAIADVAGGYGLWTYYKNDPETGVQTPEILSMDQTLKRYAESALTVYYTGIVYSEVIISLFLDNVTSTYKCQITADGSLVVDEDLGTGVDEVSPVTIQDLANTINALSSFTAAGGFGITTPAAFLSQVYEKDIIFPSTAILNYLEPESVITPNAAATLWADYYAARNNDDFENASAVQINNTMYFGCGYEETYKYDGHMFHRAGMPKPSITAIGTSGGAITGTNYQILVQYEYIDANGNITTGNMFESDILPSLSSNDININITQVQEGTNFNTNCAVVSATVGTPTDLIPVDNGSGGTHTIALGDTIYFYDDTTSSYVTRVVNGVEPTSISIAGDLVTVTNNAVISANLRIVIWRNKTSGAAPTLFYLVDEIPNNSFVTTQAYRDNTIDADLGALYEPPATDRSLPPKGKYLTQWNGILLVGGNFENPNSLYYSDIDGPEYFPAGSNDLLLESSVGDVITGVSNNDEVLCVFKTRSFATIVGEITTGQVRVEFKSLNVGGVGHSGIAKVGAELFWPSNKGPRRTKGGSSPYPLGLSTDPTGKEQDASRIDTIVDNTGKTDEEKFVPRRATSVDFVDEQKYLMYLPAESVESGNNVPNSNSRVYVYDYARDAWLIWDNILASGGITTVGEDIYYSERRWSDTLSTVTTYLYKMQKENAQLDYVDHIEPVNFSYSAQWESLGNPVVLKKFIKIRLISLDQTLPTQFTLTVKQELDYNVGTTEAEFDVTGGGTALIYTHGLARKRSKAMKVIFENANINENVYITGWELEASTPYNVEMKP